MGFQVVAAIAVAFDAPGVVLYGVHLVQQTALYALQILIFLLPAILGTFALLYYQASQPTPF